MFPPALVLLALVSGQTDAPSPAPAPAVEPTVVTCRATGLTRITWLRPAGERVGRGDRLALLDPTAAQSRLTARGAFVELARRQVSKAVLEREAADLTVAEARAIDESELVGAREQVRLAKAAREVARLRLEEARKARSVIPGNVRMAEVGLQEATDRLAAAERRVRILEGPGASAATREALAEARLAKSEEAAAVARHDAALEAAAEAQAQFDACTIVAPAAGTLVYVRDRPPGDERGYAPIEVGAFAREGQALFRILPEPQADR